MKSSQVRGTGPRGPGAWAVAALVLAACGGGGHGSNADGGDGIGGSESASSSGGDTDVDPPPAVEDCDNGGLAPRLLRQLTRDEYRRTAQDLLGVEVTGVDTIPVEPVVHGFDNNAAALVVTQRHVSAYHDLGTALADKAVTGPNAPIIGCDASSPDCPRQFVETLGRRALRRPLSAEEVEMYLELFDPVLTENSFEQGARLVVRSLLLAPEFIYRVEIGERTDAGDYRLTPWEVASSLSYLYWGTMPDDELFALAASGELANEDVIAAQAERLLDHQRGREHVLSFVQQYLGTQAFRGFFKDDGVFPEYTAAIQDAMQAEELAFVEQTFLGGGSWSDLFTGNPALADATLTAFYGDNGNERGTLLTLGTVLASHALQQESSPIRRGLFVREDVLCQPLAPPPSDRQISNPQPDATQSTRERFEQHSADPFCASCHRNIDGLGFMLERYDGVGRYRTEDNGILIDESGLFHKVGEEIDASRTLSGTSELLDVLEQNPVAERCLARRYFRFARGFTESSKIGLCAVESLEDAFLEQGADLRSLLLSVVRQPSFVLRQGGAS